MAQQTQQLLVQAQKTWTPSERGINIFKSYWRDDRYNIVQERYFALMEIYSSFNDYRDKLTKLYAMVEDACKEILEYQDIKKEIKEGIVQFHLLLKNTLESGKKITKEDFDSFVRMIAMSAYMPPYKFYGIT